MKFLHLIGVILRWVDLFHVVGLIFASRDPELKGALKKLSCLGYTGDCTTQLNSGDYNKPV